MPNHPPKRTHPATPPRPWTALLALEPPNLSGFDDPLTEWRRLFAELFGTFLLVLVACGGPVVGALSPGSISRSAAVAAPGLMVMAVILFMGAVSGAHLNPAVTLAFRSLFRQASRAQNVGPLSALAVGGYIILAGLWASPVSGASMNPARSFGPDLALADFGHYWVYLVGPLAGAVIATGFAWILRGPGGDIGGVTAAQGRLD